MRSRPAAVASRQLVEETFVTASQRQPMFPTLDLLGTRFARSQRLLCAALTALADKKGSATDPHLQHMTYHLTITTAPRSVRVRTTGDLDYQTRR